MGTWALTGLAALVVVLALTTPNRLQDVEPAAFVRLPLEALVYLAVVLALPPSLGRIRTTLAVVAGIVLGLSVVLRLLDIGFHLALDRPFDALIDWRYTGSLVETLRDSVGDRLGTTLLVLAGLAALALLVLLPIAVLRVTRVAARHRGPACRAVAALGPSGWSWRCWTCGGTPGRWRPGTPPATSTARSAGSRPSFVTSESSRRPRRTTRCATCRRTSC